MNSEAPSPRSIHTAKGHAKGYTALDNKLVMARLASVQIGIRKDKGMGLHSHNSINHVDCFTGDGEVGLADVGVDDVGENVGQGRTSSSSVVGKVNLPLRLHKRKVWLSRLDANRTGSNGSSTLGFSGLRDIVGRNGRHVGTDQDKGWGNHRSSSLVGKEIVQFVSVVKASDVVVGNRIEIGTFAKRGPVVAILGIGHDGRL